MVRGNVVERVARSLGDRGPERVRLGFEVRQLVATPDEVEDRLLSGWDAGSLGHRGLLVRPQRPLIARTSIVGGRRREDGGTYTRHRTDPRGCSYHFGTIAEVHARNDKAALAGANKLRRTLRTFVANAMMFRIGLAAFIASLTFAGGVFLGREHPSDSGVGNWSQAKFGKDYIKQIDEATRELQRAFEELASPTPAP